jgi:hypothetical protein
MRAPSSVIFDVVATRITCPLPRRLTSMTRSAEGQHQPVTPVGRQMDFHNDRPGASEDFTGEVPWPGKSWRGGRDAATPPVPTAPHAIM